MSNTEATTPQSFANHSRLVPLYHFVIPAVLLFNVVGAVMMLTGGFSIPGLAYLLTSLILFPMWLYSRVFPLGVQDRLIRLEQQVRMHRVLPDDLKARIGELTKDQYIGLRFASDAELPGLVKEALDGKLDRTAVKQKVQNWQPDHWRI
ncbi:MAG: DUF6526 family protein [Planctomycetota bacterium]